MGQNDQPASIHERMRRSPLRVILRPLTLVASILLAVRWSAAAMVGKPVYPQLNWDLHLTGFVVANALMDTAKPTYQEGRVTGMRDGKVNIAVTLNDGRTGRARLRTPESIRGNERIRIRVRPGGLRLYMGACWTAKNKLDRQEAEY